MNLFWLFLILRIAKNYVFNNAIADERSDSEEEETDGEVKEGIAKQVNGTKPTVLLNGEPVDVPQNSAALRERRRKG